MILKSELDRAKIEAAALIEQAGIYITNHEKEKITAADFGLSNLWKEGIEILTLFETERIAAKILVLFPFQTEPEHWHPSVDNDPGKEEIIRAVWGDLYFYIPGADTRKKGFLIEGKENVYTMRHEEDLAPGDQLILPPGTKHWFQAGARGAVMYSFSTTVRDVMDQFSDPDIVRTTVIK
ncbi:MAG: D-lyxose/D-mannose family sugar isomerase [Saprospiraceae bacterium]|nr:D-lyxose/D-mannose family sugar isomerase [Saprospiraceae bacterium]